MKQPWPEVPLYEVCGTIVDCVNKTAPVVEGPTPYRMIRTTNVKSGVIDLATVRYVTEETYRAWTRRQMPRPGDVILTREAPLGEVGMLREADGVFLGQRLMSYRADPDKLDAHFLLYALQEDHLQDQIRATGAGATVEHMRVPDAENLRIKLPPLHTQRKIAAVLSAYDDLIENNTRRAQILEEMARALYREWFVEYRYPSHEQDEFSEDEQGRRPDEWSWVPMPFAIDIDPKTKVAKDGLKSFVPMSSLSEDSMIINDIEKRSGNSGAKFKNGDTLFARISPCLENGKTGYVNFLPDDSSTAFGSTEYIVMRSRLVCPEYVYLLSRLPEFRSHAEASMSGATGRQRVKSESFANYMIALPPSHLIKSFEALTKPLFDAIFNLASRSANLRRTRDLLLPKLVSGELDVSTLDVQGVEEQLQEEIA
ncbi:restriction endonuclease subunit S [Deinococcus depolymerans]|uniref:Restriction endonuclease subunit S n=1 Tax=Deinococcus depolymerans TaxID=392408 RepID=A0ABN1CC07_9DEIO